MTCEENKTQSTNAPTIHIYHANQLQLKNDPTHLRLRPERRWHLHVLPQYAACSAGAWD